MAKISKQSAEIYICAQINPILGDIESNTRLIIDTCEQFIPQSRVIVFPELAICGYPPEDLLFRPNFHQRIKTAVGKICDQQWDAYIILGCPTLNQNNCYNSALVIYRGEIIACYHKQQLPNHSVFDEKRYFLSGSAPCVINIDNIPTGILICEDLWHETTVVATHQAGAEQIISIHASPFITNKHQKRIEFFSKTIQKINIPLLYCNMIGGQDELVFDGGSFLMNHLGEITHQANFFEKDYLSINQGLCHTYQKLSSSPNPEEKQIYQALQLGLKDYVEKNHFPGVLIGLSGGIDSALTLAIAVDALGPDRVNVVMMPSRFTADISHTIAIEQINNMNVKYDNISIEPIFKSYLEQLSLYFSDLPADNTEQNLQARCRGNLLMALSNKFGKMVVTTSNKSEMAVGYSTLYGDMAGGFAILKDIPKTWVYRLALYRNRINQVIPPAVIDRPPSAELADNQQDDDTLPPYPILDDIIYRSIDLNESIDMIIACGHERTVVEHVVKLIYRNEYKRRQAPIGVRISEHAFGKDRRYPITSGF